MPSPLEAKSEVTTGKHGDKGRYVTTDQGSQIFLTQDGKIGQTGKSIGGEMNWKPVGQPKPKQDWIEPGSRSGEAESDLPGESGDAKPQYESPFVQSFAESIIANIRKHEQQKQQPKPSGPNPQDHEHHISKLPIPMRQSMLNWSAEAQTLINPVAWASQGSTFGSGDPRAVKKATFDKIDKAELNRVVGSLSKLISVGDQQGVNLRPFIRHNNIIPRELAAKLKPSDLFNPVQDNERYRADTSTLADQFTAILTERYAAISQSTLRNLAGKIDKPTEGQIESGNYRKGHVRLHGLDITIENAKGTRRRPEWPKLAAHYGYIKRTMGRDGDHVDVFIGPNLSSELIVVIDQVSQGGRFDEHKCLIGFDTTDEAIAVYRKCYTSDWKVGPITTMTIGQFKAWLKSGDQTKQISGQVSKYDVQSQADIVIDRMIAAEMGITVEQYAARRAKNSPGQLGLFGDGIGGDEPLRTASRQQKLDWDESKVKRDDDGKFATSAGGEGAKAITKNEHGVHVITQDDIGAGGDGTFDQLHAGLASEIVQSKIAIGMKGIEGREYAIMQTKGGKWQLASRKAESGKEPTARERAQNRFKELNPDSKSTPAKPTGPEVLHEHTGPEGIVAKVTPSIHGYHVQAYKPNGEKFGGSRTVKRGDDAMEKAKKIAREISHPDNYLSDQEKTERELAGNAADVAGDPKNARSRNLHRAIGYQNSLLRHYERKIQRGEGNEKQLKDFISGIESEIQWYESILKDRGDYAGGGPYSDESGFDSEGVAIPKSKKAAARDKPKFNFDQHVKIAADDISKLRKSDVYRLIETVPDTDTAKMVADMIGQKRPDLKDEAMSSLFDYLQDAPTPGKYSAALVDMIADLMIADELGLTVDQYAARKKSQKGQQELEWITVNADKGKGQPVMIDKKDGTIQAGMGGKFNGQNIGEIGKGGKDTSREKGESSKVGNAQQSGLSWKASETQQGKWAWFDGKDQVSGAFNSDDDAENALESLNAAGASKIDKTESGSKDQKPATDSEEMKRVRKTYASLTNEEIESKLGEMTAEISSLQNAAKREFNQDGGRRTSAAVSAQGARNVGEEKLLLSAYLKERQATSETPSPGSKETPAPQPAPEKPATQPTAAKKGFAELPSSVQDHVKRHVGVIKEANKQIELAKGLDKRFGGGGRYESEVREKFENSMKTSMEKLREFMGMAEKNGFDGNAIIEGLGGSKEFRNPSPGSNSADKPTKLNEINKNIESILDEIDAMEQKKKSAVDELNRLSAEREKKPSVSLIKKINKAYSLWSEVSGHIASLSDDLEGLRKQSSEIVTAINKEQIDNERRENTAPAPKPAEYEPPTIPGQQTSLFGGDDLNTGQKSLFNMARPSKADQRAAKRDMAPPSASLLEQIDDEEKKRIDSRKSLPGQRDMFMAQFEAAMIEQYRVAVKPKADKPEKPKAVIGNKGDRGRFITTEGGDVVFLEGKMQPDGLIDTSKAVARKKREKAKHTNPDKFVPVTDEEKAIVQAVGDKKKDVAYFKQFVDEAHKEISGRLKSDTDAMRETLAQFGYTGTKASGFLSSLQRRRDTANIPGFDEMLDYVQKHYRQLLTARPGESTGAGDEESMLFNRLKAGFPPPPKKSDQEVIDAAWGMSGIDYSGLPSEWEGETREADDEVLHGEIDDDLEDAPFAASPLAVTERYAFTFATAFKNAYRRELVTSKIMEQYQVKHAPEGGETVGGKKYKGGQFVPGDANSEKNAGNQSDDWFNKSKIVDDHGKPLLLYHGNRGESDLGSGWVSFTDNENHAAMFGEVQQMHLKMENPFDITSLGSGGDPDSSETISGKNLSDAFAEHGIQIDFGGEKRKGFTTELMFPKKAEIREKLMSAGFDGIIVTDYFEFDAPEYIVFDESQIKVIPNDDGHDDDEDEYDS